MSSTRESEKCPSCKSEKIVKQGFRKNKSGKKQKFQCSDCGKYFVIDDGFKGMKHKSKIIVKAIHMHTDGLSLSKVQNHLFQYDNVKVARKTIAEWTKKYSIFFRANKQRGKAKNKRKNPCR